MSVAAIVSSVGLALLVIALAIYLALIMRALARANRVLGDVLETVRDAARRAEPVGDSLREISDEVTKIADTLHAASPGRFATQRRRE